MHVSCRATRIMLDAAEAVGVSRHEAAARSGQPLALLEDVRGRIEWATYAAFCEGMWALIDRDPDRARLIGEALVLVPSTDLFLRLAANVISPAQLYQAGARWLAPTLFPCVSVVVERLAQDRLRVESALAPGLVGCEPFFRFSFAALTSQPRLLGLPDARVEATFSARGGHAEVWLPRSRSLFDRVRRATRAAFNEGAILELLEEQRRELDRGFSSALRASDTFRELLDNLPDMVLVHRSGHALWVNRALARTLGYGSVTEMVGLSLLDLVHPLDRARVEERMRRPPLDPGLPPLATFRLLRKDRAEVVAEIAPTQQIAFQGAPARLVVARDITERVRMEQKLVLADRMASLGVLAAGVGHEINNPLAYAIGNVELAAAQVPAGPVREALATALDGLGRVRTIVKDLKTFSRGDEGETMPADVRAALESTLTLVGKELERRARVVREFGPVPHAHGNPARLSQVFLNLVLNAIEAMAGRAAQDCELRLRTLTGEDGAAVVEIEDTGVGIAPEIAGRIFEPFFTTRPVGGGTGLGLSICHQIVTGLGGTIRVRSQPGHGATFRVTLPAAAQAPAPSPAPAPPRARPARARVLVIDDEPHFGNLLRVLLGEQDVEVVSSGSAALELLARDRAFDVILCDLMMPGLSGADVHVALAKSAPELCAKVIFMTGAASSDRARELLGTRENRCLEKPFGGEELSAAIAEVVGRAPIDPK